MKALVSFIALAVFALPAAGQSPGVPIYRESRSVVDFSDLTNAASRVWESGEVIKLPAVREQLRRTSCQLDLPAPNRKKLPARELWERAHRSYLRVGWYLLCTDCQRWHLELAGGYLLTPDGVVCTCYHVVRPGRDIREGGLVAADDAGKIYPVTEVLAASRASDVCIVRIEGSGFESLPLNTDVRPGDTVYCFSDPLRHRGYFSQGIVNRFFQLPPRRARFQPGAPLYTPTQITVSTDWAPGSSGAAVLDECGNAIGHVCSIAAEGEDEPAGSTAAGATPALIVFHEAVSARDVLALIKPAK